MNAPPSGMSPEAFEAAVDKHVQENYEAVGTDGGMKCKKCGGEIQCTTCYVSLHTSLFRGCAGGGRVVHIPLPFCPTCEGMPDRTSSCVHVPGVV